MPPGPFPFSHRHFASDGLPAGGGSAPGEGMWGVCRGTCRGSAPGEGMRGVCRERAGGAHRGVVEEHHAASAYFGEIALLRGPSFMPYS